MTPDVAFRGKAEPLTSLVDVREHFQRDEVVVVSHFIGGILGVEAKQVLENANVKGLPVLSQNVHSLLFMLHQESHKVN